jgi:hypothetical protein
MGDESQPLTGYLCAKAESVPSVFQRDRLVLLVPIYLSPINVYDSTVEEALPVNI